MTVYGEVLFAENFITGWIILLITGNLCGHKVIKRRVAAGAIMCGMYAFVLFVPLHWVTALISKVLFSVIVVLSVFGKSTCRGILKTAGVFYTVSFLMGGVTIALMYMTKLPFVTDNGSFVMEGTTFLQLAAGVTSTWYLGNWLAVLLRERMYKQRVFRSVEVCIGGKQWKLKGFVDTGNSLKDPVTGKMVAVLSKEISAEISGELDAEQFGGFRFIPYRTVGRTGLITVIRPDTVSIDGSRAADVLLGLGERNFAPWRGEKYDLLLHQQFLEGEEQDYGEKYDDGKCK